MEKVIEVNVQSEIGKLNGVIIHTPGEEVENMTPENAERALYSDIINLSIAREEYKTNQRCFIKADQDIRSERFALQHPEGRKDKSGSTEPD